MKAEQTDKLTKVLDATEHPEQYTDEQLRQLLNDEECAAFYRLMCDAASACASSHTESDADVEAEWQRFRAKTFSPFRFVFKVAAALLTIMILSGIGYASVRLIHSEEEKATVHAPSVTVTASQPAAIEDAGTDADSIYTFRDAELQDILTLITSHYHLLLEYRREEARHVRLYMKWNQSERAEAILERLNRFEKVNLTLSGNKIIVE
jgi:hypothetical protein